MRSLVWCGNVFPCTSGRQCARWCGLETYFLVSAEGNALGVVAWKRGSFSTRRAIRPFEWRRIVVPFLCGGQCARGLVWKRVPFHPRRAMRLVEWRGNVFPCTRGGQFARWSGVETCFLASAEGKAHGGEAWKRVSLYPRRAMC